jgi:tetratricopeptide (TPR) repeat protein
VLLGFAILGAPATAAEEDIQADWAVCLQERAQEADVVAACTRTLEVVRSGVLTITGANYTREEMAARVKGLRARAYLARGDHASALRDLNSIGDVSKPQLINILTDRAEERRRSGDLAGARRDVDRALALDPGNVVARDLRGKIGETVAAPAPTVPPAPDAGPRTLLPPTIAQSPRPVEPPDLCAKARTAPGVITNCTYTIESATASPERKFAAYRKRADARLEMGQPEAALADLRAADGLRPGDAAIRSRIAVLERTVAAKEAPSVKEGEQAREAPPTREAVSEAVARRVQAALTRLGYDIGGVDGIWGSRSASALRQWQARAGRSVTGQPEEQEVALLEAAARELPAPAPRTDEALEPGELPPAARLEPAPPEERRHDEAALPSMPRAGAVPKALETPAPPAGRSDQGLAAAPPVTRGLARPTHKSQQRMLALVIGNSAYEKAVPLPNAQNDAADMAAALAEIGFEVMQGIDLSREALDDLSIAFARKVADADIGLVYYAGHGVQVRDRNYLLPIDATLEDERDLRRMLELQYLIDDTGQAKQAGIVVVDACRDNPLVATLQRTLRGSLGGSVAPGLAQPIVPNKMLVAYSTQPSATAADGTGRNSPFTAALLRHLREPGLDLRTMFGRVREEVVQATAGRQSPPVFDVLPSEPVYLVPPIVDAALDPEDLTLPERRAMQEALKRLEFYDDQSPEPSVNALRIAIQLYQWKKKGAVPTGKLTAREIVELYGEGLAQIAAKPLPTVDMLALSDGLERGDPGTQATLGMIHDSGFTALDTFPKSDELALRWYRRAAQAGDVVAAERLGLILKGGQGVPADQAEAVKWLRVAADAGRMEAQVALADLYLEGRSVSASEDEAIRLLQLAARQEDGGIAITRLRVLGWI